MVSLDNGLALAGRWLRVLWLAAVHDAGAGLVPPPISTVVLNREGGVVCGMVVYMQRGSVEVLQVTRSLLFLVILCCCVVLCYRSPCDFLHVPRSYCKLLIQFLCGVVVNKCMVPSIVW